MKKHVVMIALAAALLSAPPVMLHAADGPKPLKVFILAGQSNMEGQGVIKMDPARNEGKGSLEFLVKNPATADRFKHLVDAKGAWVVRSDVWIWYLGRKGGLTVGYGAKEDRIGPELQFGNLLGDYFENQVLLIKLAWGGKSLAKDFRPPSSGGEVGPFYTEVVKQTKEVLANLKAHFPDYGGTPALGRAQPGAAVPQLAGFGWHQGWNDGCSPVQAAEYEKNMANFIRDIRKDLGAKDLPFVIANSGFGGREQKIDRRLQVINAQIGVAGYEEFKKTVACVETRDFFRPPELSPTRQGYHWNGNAETYFLIGDGMGKAMVDILKGRSSQAVSSAAAAAPSK